MRRLTVCICFTFLGTSFYGQYNSQKTYYNWFDELVSVENTGIYDGIAYVETFRVINEKTKFFKSLDYLSGSILYDGQPYFDLEMKYDVFAGDVLVKLQDRLGGTTIRLFKDKIKTFEIDGHRFVKIENKRDPNISGFYEIVSEEEYFTLFLKHIKKDFARNDRNFIYHEFIDQKGQSVLEYGGKFYVLENKKEITTIFPEFKKEINKFYSVARRLQKSDPSAFIKALTTRLDILLSESKDIPE